MKTPILALIGVVAILACNGGGGSHKKKNSAKELPDACPSGLGAADDCKLLRIKTEGNQDLEVQLRITNPDPLAVPLGTVVLGSGGLGDRFYAELPGGDLLVQALSQAGWKVIDRSWAQGWFTTDQSVKGQSRRYAVMLGWIEKNEHQGGALAATGNDSGASEIAYALTTWDGSAQLDAAVLTAGPTMARLDYLCDTPVDPAWEVKCRSIVPAGSTTCAPACSDPLVPVCPFISPAFTPLEVAEDSILHSGAALDFGPTGLDLIFGQDDCTAATPQGLLFSDLVTSNQRSAYVPNTGNGVYETQEGRDAIVSALMSHALPAPALPPLVHERVTILGGSGEVTLIERAGR